MLAALFSCFFLVFVYLIYTYRDNAQQKCCAKVSYKANLHFQSLGRMLLQNYNIQSKTIQQNTYNITSYSIELKNQINDHIFYFHQVCHMSWC